MTAKDLDLFPTSSAKKISESNCIFVEIEGVKEFYLECFYLVFTYKVLLLLFCLSFLNFILFMFFKVNGRGNYTSFPPKKPYH